MEKLEEIFKLARLVEPLLDAVHSNDAGKRRPRIVQGVIVDWMLEDRDTTLDIMIGRLQSFHRNCSRFKKQNWARV